MKKAIYVLGGMGPQASVELYRMIIDKAPGALRAGGNEDYPEIVIHSLPVPDFISDESSMQEAQAMLNRAVDGISSDKYAYFAIACNTAHLLAGALIKRTNVPFISMIDEVVAVVRQDNIDNVGLLASPTTIKTALYQDKLIPHGVNVLVPTKRDLIIVEEAIRAVIANKPLENHTVNVQRIVKSLYARGAQKIILGCTELPLFLGSGDRNIISSLEVLRDSILVKYSSQ